MKIQCLPKYEKPREKALYFGIEALSNIELLALLIRHGTKQASAIDIATQLLYETKGLGKLSRASLYELKQIQGISTIKAIEIQAIFELMRRLSFEEVEQKDVIQTPFQLLQWLQLEIGFDRKEKFMVVYLNNAHHILSYQILFEGTINATAVYIREIMKEALLRDSAALIVVHNHPSQNMQPSKQDIQLTKEMMDVASKIGVTILDHIIVSGHASYSILHEHMISTEENERKK